MSDIDTVLVESLKTLDPERPIREADDGGFGGEKTYRPFWVSRGSLDADLRDASEALRRLRQSGSQFVRAPSMFM